MSETEWPRTKSDGKNKGNGRLPIHIPEQTFLADFNHRVKVVGKSVYFLATKPKKGLRGYKTNGGTDQN